MRNLKTPDQSMTRPQRGWRLALLALAGLILSTGPVWALSLVIQAQPADGSLGVLTVIHGGDVYTVPDGVTTVVTITNIVPNTVLQLQALPEGDASFSDLIPAGSLWAGVDTLFGPVTVGFGLAEGGKTTWYVYLGRLFGAPRSVAERLGR